MVVAARGTLPFASLRAIRGVYSTLVEVVCVWTREEVTTATEVPPVVANVARRGINEEKDLGFRACCEAVWTLRDML